MADSFAVTVRRNAYVDSVSLLQVSAELLSLSGVLDAALVMATDLNRQVLHDAGLLVDDAQTAGPNDLVIAVRASDASVAYDAKHKVWLISSLGILTPDPTNESSFLVDVIVNRSTDGGMTWSRRIEVASNAAGYANGVRCCLFAADIDALYG